MRKQKMVICNNSNLSWSKFLHFSLHWRELKISQVSIFNFSTHLLLKLIPSYWGVSDLKQIFLHERLVWFHLLSFLIILHNFFSSLLSIPNSPPSEILEQSKWKKEVKTYRRAEDQELQKINVEKFLKQVGQEAGVLRQEPHQIWDPSMLSEARELVTGWIPEQSVKGTSCYISFMSPEFTNDLIQNRFSINICWNRKK